LLNPDVDGTNVLAAPPPAAARPARSSHPRQG